MDEQEKIKGEPVHQHDSYWWFWDEEWTKRLGPYPSFEEAEMALSRYAMSHWCEHTLLHSAKMKTKHPLWTGTNLY